MITLETRPEQNFFSIAARLVLGIPLDQRRVNTILATVIGRPIAAPNDIERLTVDELRSCRQVLKIAVNTGISTVSDQPTHKYRVEIPLFKGGLGGIFLGKQRLPVVQAPNHYIATKEALGRYCFPPNPSIYADAIIEVDRTHRRSWWERVRGVASYECTAYPLSGENRTILLVTAPDHHIAVQLAQGRLTAKTTPKK